MKNLKKNSPGLFMKNRRKAIGYRQVELAKLMKISQSKLSKIEKGTAEVAIEEWFYFCEATGEDARVYANFIPGLEKTD